ncbi:aminopeptidase P family protein [Brucella anthropi]|jgi:Xaa-Pro aminopeptidase|uniref:Aminopeptidase P family protein n=1 Tax=Brucella anthropi TaxID=529 RepID=A0A6I0DXV8_BRUAN|nr:MULTISPECIES: aminopeptidase P family protein [Brucella/Ochrobactrum group]MCR5942844.1 aminopeptidase P family protein [Ochrobactrum sp. XJ1]QTN03092.1 M24 family metallopeptidase [Ochrobactrum sp. EEELCW01]KAB2737832.1 aminopeptidase P family protein [Brucella anthropi]KAB2760278.1 aminopeptidase P family protein [Brucella anthropi]KAB2771492.1 aminopeptidase P family protein [Brucella anthropi]
MAFQSFDVTTNPANGGPRVAKLRAKMAELGLDGFLVPRADEHQGEYVPPHAQRLAWLTGFTGSAGAALILENSAYIFVDGRYELQVRAQTDPKVFSYESLVTNPPASWLAENGKGLNIGFDPWLHTISEARALREALENQGGQLVPVEINLVDAVWNDQPEVPTAEVTIQPARFSGHEAEDKIKEMQAAVAASGASATVLTDPSSVAWVFNIRGKDVSNTPLPLSFAIIPAKGEPELFIDERKLAIEPRAYLTQLAKLSAPSDLEGHLSALAAKAEAILLDPTLAAEQLRLVVTSAGGSVIEGKDPARIPRAIKNKAELDGSRAAHERDGVAMVNFLSWVDGQKPGTIDEISAAQKLEESRADAGRDFQMPLEDISFDTISGAGPNGAIIHYRVNTDTNRTLEDGELYLVDSGAQYRDGTTDITRTVPIGKVTPETIKAFTLVLKGVIAITTARFPKGTRGQDIDVLARIALWKYGFDYAHGTGHGVGSYLSVHEGPQSISKKGAQELLPGMILSNEPGYYKPGSFGIRIENLIIVTEPEVPEGGDIPMMGFETLTFCPIDRRLIDKSLFTHEEIDWLNSYHASVREKLSGHLKDAERKWLEAATAPL